MCSRVDDLAPHQILSPTVAGISGKPARALREQGCPQIHIQGGTCFSGCIEVPGLALKITGWSFVTQIVWILGIHNNHAQRDCWINSIKVLKCLEWQVSTLSWKTNYLGSYVFMTFGEPKPEQREFIIEQECFVVLGYHNLPLYKCSYLLQM